MSLVDFLKVKACTVKVLTAVFIELISARETKFQKHTFSKLAGPVAAIT
jgi:hypothetical protein